jgi:anti-sigma regulatory factor (Ser/Thr protein kinase)
VRHAYDRGSEVDVVVEMEVQRSTLVVTVRDAGEWRMARPGNPGGRGLGIMGRVADDVSIDRRSDGTTLRLTFDLSGGGRSTTDGSRQPERDAVR